MNHRWDEVSRLARVLLRAPDAVFAIEGAIEAQWRDLAWHAPPDAAGARREFEAFAGLLRAVGAETVLLGPHEALTLDALYVRDSLISTPAGLVRARMGKPQRAGEPAFNAAMAEALGERMAGEISGAGRVEGGDLVWLDEATLIAGHTYRTNAEGIGQLRDIVAPRTAVHTFHMPHYKGPGDVFHLMSVLSPIDHDLALVYRPLAPVPLLEFLDARGIAFVDVPDEEFASMGCNVLATAPRRCIMVEGNPRTRRRLERAGAEVHVIEAAEICRKGEGGPTCLTRPVLRIASPPGAT
jgi:N-dimethylarginine dimethylaminohydrolase